MALTAGDIVFIGWDADNNDVVFLTTTTLPAGEVIYFTDTEWDGTEFAPGEQTIRWTVPQDIPPGTTITIDMISNADGGPDALFYEGTSPGDPADALGGVEYLRGGGALSINNEQFWAVQGTYDPADRAPTPDPDGFISVIANEAVGDPGGPVLTNTGLGPDTGAVAIDGDEDFMIFDPVLALGDETFVDPPEVLREDLLALVGDTSNWTTLDGGGNQNPSGDGFDFNLGDLQGLPQPINAQDDVTTLFFLGDQVAFVSAITDTGTATELTTAFTFEPTDLIEIDVISSDIREGGTVDGEFLASQVIFTRVTVIREGVRYDLDVEPAAQINPSNSVPEAQGDSFFTTQDDVTIPSGLPFGPFSGTMAFSIDESFLDSAGDPVDPVIERERPDLDTNGDGNPDGGPPVTNANFNVNTTLVAPPIPCFVVGTLIDTPDGPRAVETLCVGDLVTTRDKGPLPVRWLGRVTVPADAQFAPVLFRKGALGASQDLRVSPQHRMLIRDWRAELFFGVSECLIAAKHLVDGEMILNDTSSTTVSYVHLLFDDHVLIKAAGVWSESYFPGSYGLTAGSGAVERELKRLFPERFGAGSERSEAARPILRRYEASLITGPKKSGSST